VLEASKEAWSLSKFFSIQEVKPENNTETWLQTDVQHQLGGKTMKRDEQKYCNTTARRIKTKTRMLETLIELRIHTV
jgi:hypothetical protein